MPYHILITGAKAIKDAVSYNEDGSIDVYFKGINKAYSISNDEFLAAKSLISPYSIGDDDVLVIELAAEKYRDELRESSQNSFLDGIASNINNFLADYMFFDNYKTKTNLNPAISSLSSGNPAQILYLLTGKNASYARFFAIEDTLNNFQNTPNSFMVVSFSDSFTTKDVEGYSIDLVGRHSYAVKDVTEDNISLVNPYNSFDDITIPRSDLPFFKSSFVYSDFSNFVKSLHLHFYALQCHLWTILKFVKMLITPLILSKNINMLIL